MGIQQAIARTIRRLNFKGTIAALKDYGQKLYNGLAEEFNRVNDFRRKILTAVVPNDQMDTDTILDNEEKYGVPTDINATDEERIMRIIQAAARDGNGGPDWLEDQLQSAGFDLYVILNTKDVSSVFQFGDFQFNDVQFGGAITYTDPRTIDGELVASSPNGNIGPLFVNFGSAVQFGPDVQFGTLIENTAVPRPKPFQITSNPNLWGYIFFISPFPDRVAGPTELLSITAEEWSYLRRLVIQLKHVRNWAIVQVEVT
jgi:hypothetical protein